MKNDSICLSGIDGSVPFFPSFEKGHFHRIKGEDFPSFHLFEVKKREGSMQNTLIGIFVLAFHRVL
jgi:hypothetical protein